MKKNRKKKRRRGIRMHQATEEKKTTEKKPKNKVWHWNGRAWVSEGSYFQSLQSWKRDGNLDPKGPGPIVFAIEGSFPVSVKRSIQEAGGRIIILPSDADNEIITTSYRKADAVLVMGGGDLDPTNYGQANSYSVGINPRRDAVERAVIRQAIRDKKPILGICRGLQMTNVASGGSLYQDVPYHSNVEHDVIVKAGTVLRGVLGSLVDEDGWMGVNSFHHQCVQNVAPGWKVAAYEGVIIEALEHSEYPWIGLQWHPELLTSTDRRWLRIFRWLVDEAEAWRQAHRKEREAK